MQKKTYARLIIQSWLQLMKFRLSFTVALSTLAGYFMYERVFNMEVVALLVGVMLLASGVAVINQFQERKTDLLMARTKKRPIPRGLIKPNTALISAFILIILGIAILYLKNGLVVALLGMFNAFWYNFIYTPLKQKTAFAVIPGAVCGAIPPIMGWVVAGGYVWHTKILLLAFFFFVWQIPHFWLILLKYGKEYANAGLPSVTNYFYRDQLRNITFVWLIASGVSALFLPVFSMVNLPLIKMAVVALVVTYITLGFWSLFKSQEFINFKMSFMVVNIFMILIIVLIVLDKVL